MNLVILYSKKILQLIILSSKYIKITNVIQKSVISLKNSKISIYPKSQIF